MSRIEDNCVFMYLSLSYINNKFTRFFILSALAVHRPFYFSICISTLHTRFILYVARHGSCMTLLNCIQYMWIFDNIPIYSTGKIVFLYCKLFNKEETADEYEDMRTSQWYILMALHVSLPPPGGGREAVCCHRLYVFYNTRNNPSSPS